MTTMTSLLLRRLTPRHVFAVNPSLSKSLNALFAHQSIVKIANAYDEIRAAERREEFPLIKYDVNNTFAYIAFRMLSAMQITERILTHAKSAGWKPVPHVVRTNDTNNTATRPLTVLDFGAGPGSGSWAVRNVIPEEMRMETTFVETSIPMVDAASLLSRETFRSNWSRNLPDLVKNMRSRRGAARFDVVLCTFVLGELPSPEARSLALALLWECLAPGGVMVLAEHVGSHHATRGAKLIGSARDELIRPDFPARSVEATKHLFSPSKAREDEAFASRFTPRILAPCGHSKPCPLAAAWREKPGEVESGLGGASAALRRKPWCHFTQHTQRLIAPKDADAGKTQVVRYSYLVVEKSEADALAPPPPPGKRILRTPVKPPGQVWMDVCEPKTGALERVLMTKGKASKDDYREARKATWGDLWRGGESVLSPEVKAARRALLGSASAQRRRRRRTRSSAKKGEPDDVR